MNQLDLAPPLAHTIDFVADAVEARQLTTELILRLQDAGAIRSHRASDAATSWDCVLANGGEGRLVLAAPPGRTRSPIAATGWWPRSNTARPPRARPSSRWSSGCHSP